MGEHLRKLWPVLVLTLCLFLGSTPALAVENLTTEATSVVELGPEEYGIPVYIPESLVPVGPESVNNSHQAIGLVVPIFVGVITVGFSR